jgi:hypothetical protein
MVVQPACVVHVHAFTAGRSLGRKVPSVAVLRTATMISQYHMCTLTPGGLTSAFHKQLNIRHPNSVLLYCTSTLHTFSSSASVSPVRLYFVAMLDRSPQQLLECQGSSQLIIRFWPRNSVPFRRFGTGGAVLTCRCICRCLVYRVRMRSSLLAARVAGTRAQTDELPPRQHMGRQRLLLAANLAGPHSERAHRTCLKMFLRVTPLRKRRLLLPPGHLPAGALM